MLNNPMQMIQQFNQFRSNFSGNPQEEVQRLMASGRINQQQLNQLQTMAQQFQAMLSSFNR